MSKILKLETWLMKAALKAVAYFVGKLNRGWLGAGDNGASRCSPKATGINTIAKASKPALATFTFTSTLHVVDHEPSESGLVCEIGVGWKCHLWVTPSLTEARNR